MNYQYHKTISLLKVFSYEIKSKMTYSTIFLPWYKRKPIYAVKKNKILVKKKKDIYDKILTSKVSPFVNKEYISVLNPFLKVISNFKMNYSFVVDDAVAKDIVKKILPDLTYNANIVIETNVGPGLITAYLIQSNVSKIKIIDRNTVIDLTLKQIHQEYPNRIEIFSEKTSSLEYYHKYIVSVLINYTLKSNTLSKIIGVFPNVSFFSCLVHFITVRNLWHLISLMEFNVIVSVDVVDNVLNFVGIRGKFSTYCLFNFLFQYEMIQEYPREAFLPFSDKGEEKMYLFKITPNIKHFHGISEENLKIFVGFVKLLGRSRYNFIVPTLEKWIPNCGLYLISKGISMTTQTGDLSSMEFVQLFKFLTKCEGFEHFKVVQNSITEVDAVNKELT